MANWHGYLAIENVGLNDSQRDTLINVLRNIGQANDGPLPNLRNHWRVRLDNEAAIFEALFDEDQLTVTQFKVWLGYIFGVDPETISHTLQQTQYGPLATFSRPAETDRLRFLLFGDISAGNSHLLIFPFNYLLDVATLIEVLGKDDLNASRFNTPRILWVTARSGGNRHTANLIVVGRNARDDERSVGE